MSGVHREWMAPNDFVMIHLDLIKLGLSLEAALLLSRIHFRSGGEGWWYVTKAQMQADTLLSERKLDRAIGELRDHGMVAWERKDAQNPTLRWRIVWAEVGEPTNRPSREGQNVPHQKDETSFSSTKNSKNKNSSSTDVDGGGSPGAEALSKAHRAEQVDAGFARWWQVYPRKVGKQAARKAFEKALRSASVADLGQGLEQAVAQWQREGREVTKIPHATTWLNEGRWADEYPESETVGETGDETSWMRRRSE